MQANPATASLLIEYDGESSELIKRVAELGFEFATSQSKQTSTAGYPAWRVITDGLEVFNKNLRATSAGKVDLASMLFIALLVQGLVQFIRRPSPVMDWETAWWFALNVYMMIRNQKEEQAPPQIE